MDSNKLGLKIVRISQGYTDLLEINGEHSWTKTVWDVRNALANIENLDSSSSVLMLAGVENGHVLTVASYIPGRTSDCITAWIYVPATISISGKELVEIAESTKKEILASGVNGVFNDEKLYQLFSKSYESAPAAKMTVKSTGDKFACRYYGQGAKYTLSELLKDMSQSYYMDYKCLFLLDNAANIKFKSGDDLTAQKVYSTILLKAPDAIDGFVPYVNEQPFKGQVYAVEGDLIKIDWRKDGYETIKTETVVRPAFRYTLPSPEQYVRIIPYNMIQVVNERNEPLAEFELYVENKMIRKGEAIHLNEAVVGNAWIKVFAGGYNAYSKNVNLNTNQRIALVKVTYSYEFMLPLKNNAGDYSIVIESKKKMEDSPVEGYVLENDEVTTGKNYLKFKPYGAAFWRNSIIAAVFVLLLGCGAGYFLSGFIGEEPVSTVENRKLKKENKELNKDNNELKNKIKDLESKEAIRYLDNRNEWSREEMEELEMLKGLFDALNNYDFDEILRIANEFPTSSIMKEILEKITGVKDMDFDKPYTKENKIKIKAKDKNANTYLKVLTTSGKK